MFLYASAYKNKTHIIVVKNFNNISIKQIYDYEKGFLISEVRDQILGPNSFKRTINNVSMFIKNNKIEKLEIHKKLDAINYINKPNFDRNKNLGALDLETFEDGNGLTKVYAIGFITNNDTEPTLFYLTDINKEYNSDELILKCLDTMLQTKYNNFTFYAHNFGRYDVIFIYNIIQKANEIKGFEYYKINPLTRDDTILKLTITIKTKTKPLRIHIVDSLNLLNASLEKLATDFNLDIKKGYFPYLFVKRDTLLYVGSTPDIKFYPQFLDNSSHLVTYKNMFLSSN